MSKEKRYLQWGYESYRDTETGEVRTDYVDLLNTQADKIAYLEAKQAESEEKIDKLETQSIIDIDHISYYQSQYLEIKDQLAEKKKENELMGKTLKMTKFVEKEINQDKISFALEQLEKVKETTECVLDNALKNSSLNQSYYDRLLDEIDQQIKELKNL